MKLTRFGLAAALLGALLAILTAAPAFGAVTVLTTATATTSTADTGVATQGRRYVRASTWLTAGTGVVLVEEQAAENTSAPWVPVKTFTDCAATGLDATPLPCVYTTTTPAARTRMRVSVCTGCSVRRVIETAP